MSIYECMRITKEDLLSALEEGGSLTVSLLSKKDEHGERLGVDIVVLLISVHLHKGKTKIKFSTTDSLLPRGFAYNNFKTYVGNEVSFPKGFHASPSK